MKREPHIKVPGRGAKSPTWVAWYITWLFIELMPKGVVFSFLFFSLSSHLQHVAHADWLHSTVTGTQHIRQLCQAEMDGSHEESECQDGMLPSCLCEMTLVVSDCVLWLDNAALGFG